ncbi:MAG: UDP-N-acetylmuramate dehydrogenase [Lachnospiraceae bacterium]|nr:UDP-N-acetylmuramate dehydrogenase [Lachnospiraceae bacterium]
MINQSVLNHIKQIVPVENLLVNEPMSRHTTFKVGGPADLFIRISAKEQLISLVPFLRKLELDYFVIGNGSNLLVGDRGYQGVILSISECLNGINIKDDCIVAEAGAMLSRVSELAASQSLAGMEFASGIPGTIGGAVVMNAGAYGGEMSSITESVLVMDSKGEEMVLSNETMEFAYRNSVVKNRPYIVLAVTLRLAKGDAAQINQKIDELKKRRREKQPLEYASAGSTFKRPPGKFAGKLIMEAGLRGFSIGGASVSEKHCGFVINEGNATALDILEVIKEAKERVYDRFDIKLEPEIIFLGDF